jgi:hypothetical protein
MPAYIWLSFQISLSAEKKLTTHLLFVIVSRMLRAHIDVCPRAKKEIEQLLFETERGTQTAKDWARLELLATKGMSELETEGQSPPPPLNTPLRSHKIKSQHKSQA